MKTALLASLGRWLLTILLVAGAILVALWLWRRYENDPWTRDGHVRADVVRITTDVGGLVTEVHVRDNQFVHRGDLLVVVDRPRFAAALAQADANIAAARATLDLARKEARRDIALGDLVATETHEQNVAKVETALAQLAQASAARDTARLNLTRTAVHASVDGKVTNLDLHPGDFLAAGAQAMALVDARSIRIEGYFEETKLGHIHVGDRALIRLMGDPHPLYGHVDSIAGGIADDQARTTGNLLPAVQPTFEWVRLAQRIPVRVQVDRLPVGTRLIPGRTATVTILQQGAPQR
ncbi:HlyD family efflux transporter periplasmic adaptor subunit [Sphingomonas nostoxanthinifaciens]|uniref:HlyD family efflux transporter periplasmic adaptor subunit n=1 Tax=Sphingomonas nostoxanthinifaciens TaxID=2872652 RepID=UPI001CC2029A|nr:HlyD family secretion protein [Sphingomonas nostoxanthinifaciens]UAK23385.1 HlyD family secretion protein [Sphingomonas nostoxanthinifaciens]